jgi:hypothetical protein
MQGRAARKVVILLAAVTAAVPGLHVETGAATLEGGNGVYRVRISDGQLPFKCGVWTAVTGSLHPAGPELPLLFSSSGQPINSSYTTLYSHVTGRSYTTAFECTPLCEHVGPPQILPLTRDNTTVGYRLTWTFTEPPGIYVATPPLIRFVQDVLVDGPVDGSETIENSIVRETHTVENLGPGIFRFGLRKLWDLAIEADDGPLLGDCETPAAGCDRSLDLPIVGPVPAPIPAALIFRSNPPTAACPGGLPPDNPEGCDAPDLLQFNVWQIQFGTCFLADLFQGAECGQGGFFDDTSLAYHYGVEAPTGVELVPGASRSFTQYLTLALIGCPSIVTD